MTTSAQRRAAHEVTAPTAHEISAKEATARALNTERLRELRLQRERNSHAPKPAGSDER
jgi:hypothetical protein